MSHCRRCGRALSTAMPLVPPHPTTAARASSTLNSPGVRSSPLTLATTLESTIGEAVASPAATPPRCCRPLSATLHEPLALPRPPDPATLLSLQCLSAPPSTASHCRRSNHRRRTPLPATNLRLPPLPLPSPFSSSSVFFVFLLLSVLLCRVSATVPTLVDIDPPLAPQSAAPTVNLTATDLDTSSTSTTVLLTFLADQSTTSLTPSLVSAGYLLVSFPTVPTSPDPTLVNVSVSNNGVDFSDPALLFTFTTPVDTSTASFYPPVGTQDGGTVVTVNASFFTNSTSVACAFDATTTAAAYVSSTQLNCTTPPHQAGVVSVSVTNDGATWWLLSTEYTYVPDVTVTAVAPMRGPKTGGTDVTVTGSNLDVFSPLYCDFDGQLVEAVQTDNSTVVCQSPASLLAPQDDSEYSATFAVTYNGQEEVAWLVSAVTQSFTYDNLSVVSVAPQAGSALGGTLVSVVSAGVYSASDAYYCAFGDPSAPQSIVTAVFMSSDLLHCTTPAYDMLVPGDDAEQVLVSISSNLQQWSASSSLYTYIGPFNITVAQPMRGPKTGGTNVTIVGQNLNATQPLYCAFDSTPTLATQLNDTLAICTSPPSLAAPTDDSEYQATFAISYNMREMQSYDVAAVAQPFTYDNVSALAVSPASGSVLGGTVISVSSIGVYGTATEYECSFGNDTGPVPATFVSINTLTCVTPAYDIAEPGAGYEVVSVSLSSNQQQWSDGSGSPLLVQYTYIGPFNVSWVSPLHGPKAGGTNVSFVGQNLDATQPLYCSFDGVDVEAVQLNSTAAMCTSPPSALALLDDSTYAANLSLTYNGQEWVSYMVAGVAQDFTYDNVSVVALTPQAGTVLGGTLVLLNVSGVLNATTAWCSFGNTSSPAPATFVTPDVLSCTTPAYFIAELGADYEVVQVALSTNLQQWEASGALFTYIAAFNVSQVEPMRGPKTGGTSVTVTGMNLNATQPLYCLFDSVAVVATQLNDTVAECTSPASPFAPANQSEYAANFSLSYNLQEEVAWLVSAVTQSFTYDNLSVVSVAPQAGSALGGTLVSVVSAGVYSASDAYYCAFGDPSAPQSIVTAVFMSSDLLHCTTPAYDMLVPGDDAEQVLVSISSNLQQWSASSSLYTYIGPFNITVAQPMRGPKTGGTNVTIVGQNLNATQPLYCAFDSTPTLATQLNDTLAICTSPPSLAAPTDDSEYQATFAISYNMREMQSYDVAAVAQPFTYDNVSALAIDLSNGPMRGGSIVNVATTGVYTVSPSQPYYCSFGNVSQPVVATFEVNQLTCVTPPYHSSAALASVVVSVSSNLQQWEGGDVNYLYYADEAVTSVQPAFGPLSATDVLLVLGADFLNSSALSCAFLNSTFLSDAVNASFINSTALTCQLPLSPSPGLVLVSVSNNGVDYSPVTSSYELIDDYAATAIAPQSAMYRASTTLVISGVNFTDAISSGPIDPFIRCSIDGVQAPAVYVSHSALSCALPLLGPGNYSIDVTLNGVDYTASGLNFTAQPLPEVDAIAPPLAVTGQSALTVTGKRFDAGGPCLCAFINATLTSVVSAICISDTIIQCTTPLVNAGQYVVEVSVDGQFYSESLMSVDVVPAVQLSSVEPMLTPASTTTPVILRGSGFVNSPYLAVRFGSTVTGPTFIDSTQLTLVTPLNASVGNVSITVTNNGQDWSAAALTFSYSPPPLIASLLPPLGPADGGSEVIVYGFNLNVSASVHVMVGTVRVEAVAISSSVALFITPLGMPMGALDVSVSYDDDGITAGAGHYSPPVSFLSYSLDISSVTPQLGPFTAGTNLTISGVGFSSSYPLTCLINDTIISAAYLSSTTLSCLTPPMANAGAVSLTVSANGQEYSVTALTFLYLAPLSLTSVAPLLGPSSVSSTLSIAGASFFNSSTLLCRIGGTVSPALFLFTDLIVCTAASHAVGVVNVSVSNNGVDWEVTGSFTYVDDPSVASLQPTTGPSFGGSLVTVTGTNFVDGEALSCVIDGSFIAASFINSTALTCITPPVAADGALSIEISINGRAASQSGVLFTFLLPDPTNSSYTSDEAVNLFPNGPLLLGASPSIGSALGGTTVSLYGVGFSSDLTCQFGAGTALRAASVISGSFARCVAPTYPNATTADLNPVNLLVSSNGTNASLTTVAFSYYAEPALTAVALPSLVASVPEVGYSQAVVIAGAHLIHLPTALCSFGAITTAATSIGQGLLACVPPSQVPGAVSVSVALNGVDFSSSSLSFRYTALPSVLSLTPSSAPLSGGVWVTVTGGNFLTLANHSLLCVWGGTASAEAAVVDDATIVCQAPSASAQGWSPSSQLFSLLSELQPVQSLASTFSYYADYSLSSITVAAAPVGAGTAFLAVGSAFFLSASIACRFGSLPVSAGWLSSTELSCSAPATLPAGVYSLEVTCDGYSFTTSGLQFELYTQPVLSSLWPTSGVVEGGTVVTVKGANFLPLTPLSCQFGSVLSPTAVYVSPTRLLCTAPTSALHAVGSVAVTVALNAVDYTTAVSSVQFLYYQQPSVLSVSPAIGLNSGEQQLLVSGSNFQSDAGLVCHFSLASPAWSQLVRATWLYSTQLLCSSPPMADTLWGSGSHSLTVTLDVSNNGQQDSGFPVQFTYERLPLVSSISPDVGVAAGGTLVTLTTADSAGFATTGCCSFDSMSPPRPAYTSAWLRLSASTVQCSSPAFFPSVVSLDISTSDCSLFASQRTAFTFLSTPSIASVTPPAGPANGGYNVTIAGAAFVSPTSTPTCSFAGAASSTAALLSSTLLSCSVPSLPVSPGSIPFTSAVSVSMDGVYSTNPLPFTFVEQATVLSVTPALVPVDQAVQLTLLGSNFIDGPSLACLIGGRAVPASFISPIQLSCTAPPRWAARVVGVEVTNDGGTSTTSGQTFTYYLPPLTRSIFPPSGPTSGGQLVTLSGDHFLSAPATQCVWYDGMSVSTPVNVLNASALTCLTPPYYDQLAAAEEPRSLVPVAVQDAGGYWLEQAVLFAYEAAPQLLSISPSFTFDIASASTTLVTLTGLYFPSTSDPACAFGSVLSAAVWMDSSTMVCAVPAAAFLGSVALALTFHQNGDWSNSLPFAYWPEPTAISVSPQAASMAGGPLVAVSGVNFIPSGSAWCQFGSQRVTATVLSISSLQCTTPAWANGNLSSSIHVSFAVSFNEEDWAYSSGGFTYYPLVSLISVQPASALAVGGASVIVRGVNLQAGESQCAFNGVASSNSTVLSSSSLLCVVPAYTLSSISQRVIVPLTLMHQSTGAVDPVTPLQFSYDPVPAVTRVYPTNATSVGGTGLTLYGSAFVSTRSYACSVDGIHATATWIGAGAVSCSAPAHGVGAVQVSLVDVAANYSTASVSLAYTAAVTLTSLQPASGPISGGTSVLLSGSGFFPSPFSSFCVFDSTYVPLQFLNASAVLCATPVRNHTGPASLRVTCNGEDFTTGLSFTFAAPPTLLSLRPNHGSTDGGSVVTVTGASFTSTSACAFSGAINSSATHFVSATQLTCISPPSLLSLWVLINVFDAAIASWSAQSLPFSYNVQAHVLSVTPSQLYYPSVAALTVTGSSFPLDDPSMYCVLGGVTVSVATPISSTSCTCATPDMAPGNYSVEVSDGRGEVSHDGVLVQVMLLQPSVSSIHPSSGPIDSVALITVSGTNFIASSTLACVFQRSFLPATFVDAHTITCTLPAQPIIGSWPVEVTLNGVETTMQGVVFTATSLPIVLSLTPVSGPTIGGTLLTVSGVGFLSSVVVRVGSVVVQPISVSSSQLTCKTPSVPSSQAVSVEVSNDGHSFTSNGVQFAYVQAIVLASISPTIGLESGGEWLLLYANAAFVQSVNLACAFGFASGSVMVSATFVSSSVISCLTPLSVEGPAAVQVAATNNGQDWATPSLTFTFVAPAFLLSASPAAMPALTAFVLTISGSGFLAQSINRCNLGSMILSSIATTDTQLTCNVPATLPVGNLTVLASSAALDPSTAYSTRASHITSTAPLQLRVTSLPVVLALWPTQGGAAGGTSVTVLGIDFDTAHGMTCAFGSPPQKVDVLATVHSSTSLTCTSPPTPTGGDLIVPVQVASTAALLPPSVILTTRHFHYVADVSITAVSPQPLPAYTPSALTVYGRNFPSSSDTLYAVFGSILPTFPTPATLSDLSAQYSLLPSLGYVACTFLSSSWIECPVPAVDVPFTLNFQLTANLVDFTPAIPLTFYSLPSITSISPTLGPAQGGTVITITGGAFQPTPDLACRTGSIVHPATFVSSTLVTCVAPAGLNASVVAVDVSLDMQLWTTPSAWFSYYTTPLLSSLFPSHVAEGGGDFLMLRGDNFLQDVPLVCVFNGASYGEAIYVRTTAVVCVTPPLSAVGVAVVAPASSVAVSVELSMNGVGWTASQLQVWYDLVTHVTAVVPATLADATGSATLTVLGTSFQPGPLLSCAFADVAAPAVWLNSTAVTCAAPAMVSLTPVLVAVANNGVDFTTDVVTFAYVPTPTILSITPSPLPLHSHFVLTIAGENFVSNGVWCVLGNSRTVQATVSSSTAATCASPTSLLPYSTSLSLQFTSMGYWTNSLPLLYYTAPSTLTISPTHSPVFGGTLVTVTGTNFTAGVVCHWLEPAVSSAASLLNSTSLTCLTPSGQPPGVIHLRVEDGLGHFDVAGVALVLDAVVTVAAIYPATITALSGVQLTVVGSAFLPTPSLRCLVSGASVPAVFVSTSTVTCVCPALPSPGSFAVEVSNNGVDFSSSGVAFTFAVEMAISRLTPSFAAATGQSLVTVTGSNFLNSPTLLCSFGAATSQGQFVDASHVLCPTPVAANLSANASLPLAVWFGTGAPVMSIAASYQLLPAPYVGSLSPAVGPVGGGSVISVSGGDFRSFSPLWCLFNDSSPVAASVLSPTMLTCPSPAVSSPATVRLQLSVDGLTAVTSPLTFAYHSTIQLASLAPSSVSELGGLLTITAGSGAFIDSSSLSCLLTNLTNGLRLWVPATHLSPSVVQCSVPPTPMSPDLVQLGVSNNGVDFSASLPLLYRSAFTLQSVTPTSAAADVATQVWITGSNFDAAAALSTSVSCAIGAAVIPATVLNVTTLICTLPPHSSANLSIQLVDELGNSLTVGPALPFAFIARPTLSFLSPSLGASAGGTLLTLSVALPNINSAWSCLFASSYSITPLLVNSTTVQCLTPPVSALPVASSAVVEVEVEVSCCSGLISLSNASFTYADATPAQLYPPTLLNSGGTNLTITGDGFIDCPSLACIFNGSLAIPALFLSVNTISCPTPSVSAGVMSVEVTLNAQQTTSSALSVLAVAVPTVAAMSPAAGPNAGFTPLTFVGAGWPNSGGLSCVFSSGVEVAVAVVNSSRLWCSTPPSPPSQPGIAVWVSLQLYGTAIPSSSFLFSYFSPADPTVAEVSPSSGQWLGGTILTLTGGNFQNGSASANTRCRFVLSSTSSSSLLLPSPVDTPLQQVGGVWQCESPAIPQPSSAASAVYSVEVTFNGLDCSSSEVPYTFIASPLLTAMAPAMGSVVGGTSLTFAGAGFFASALLFGSSPFQLWCAFLFSSSTVYSSAVVSNDTSLTCTSPASPLSALGPVNVSLSFNQQDLSSSTPLPFTYYTQVVLTAVSPVFARYQGGTLLQLTGSGFLPTSSLSCAINGQWLPAIYINSTQLTCLCPPIPGAKSWPQTETVAVSNVAQAADASNGLPLLVYGLPQIQAIFPQLAWVYGNVSVTVTGTNFVSLAGAVCSFGGATTAALASSCELAFPYRCTQVVCTTPLHAAGTVAFSIDNNGQDSSTSPISFTYYADPILRSVHPPMSLYTGGLSVSVFSDELFQLTSWTCRFNRTVVVAATFVSDTVVGSHLLCVTPAWSMTNEAVPLDVSADGVHYGNSSLPFSFIDASVVLSISPPAGPTLGRTLITLSGTFAAVVTQCTFDTSTSVAVFANSSAVQCYSPAASSAGAVAVLLYSSEVRLTPLSTTFSYYAQPTVTDVQPGEGAVTGGTLLTLSGNGFVNNGLLACRFNASIVVAATWLSPTTALCTTPPSNSSAAGIVVLAVTNNAQVYFPLAQQFTYEVVVQMRSVAPLNGVCSGGTAVSVFGLGFSNLSTVLLSINSSVTACSFLNSSMVLCPAPSMDCSLMASTMFTTSAYPGQSVDPHQLTLPVLVSENGQDFVSSGSDFTYSLPLTITNVSPDVSVMRGFTPVVVTGGPFIDSFALSCRFDSNDTFVVTATFLSYTQLQCTAPAHTNGSFTLEVSNNRREWTVASAPFLYVPTPPGYYILGYTLTACPPGSFCVGDPLATNYTLCPIGSYQPASALWYCLPCPRGFFCPSLGMTTPTTCSAGFVCPTTSLTWASTYCPPGYYCTAGTMTAVGILNGQPLPIEYGHTSIDGWEVALLYRINGAEYYSNQTQTVDSISYYVDWTNSSQSAVDLYRDSAVRVKAAGINPTGSSRPVYWCNVTNQAGTTQIFFSAFDGAYRNVWKSDGSDAGTVAIAPYIGATPLPGFSPSPATADGNNPVFFDTLGGVIFFSAVDPTYGTQLWSYNAFEDGGEAHRVPVNLPSGLSLTFLTSTAFHVYFTSNATPTATSLWRANVTEVELIAHLSVSSYLGTLYDDLLFFAVDGALPGCELWMVDADDVNFTQLVLDVSAVGSQQLSYLDLAYFSTSTDSIGTADDVAGEDGLVGRLYIAAVNSATLAASPSPSLDFPMNRTDLWESDGTRSGTFLVSHRPYPCEAGFFCAPGSTSPYVAVNESDYDVLDALIQQLSSVVDLVTGPASGRRLLGVDPNDPSYCDSGDLACIVALALVNASDALNVTGGSGPQQLLLTALPCLDGYLCSAASTSPHGTGPCPTGHYCVHGLAAPCSPTSHCPDYGNFYPTLCPPGTYNAYEGQSFCQPCALGYTCPNWGMLAPSPCTPGFVCNDVALVRGVLCPPGLYCLTNTYTLDINDSAVALYDGLPGTPPFQCPPGTYCLVGVTSPVMVDGDPLYPQSCTPGFYCTLGASSPEGTAICPRGHYCPRGSVLPIPTSPGNFSYTTGAQTPSECLPGTWAPNWAQVQCDVCPGGFECPDSGTSNTSSTFIACEAGYYREALVSTVTCQPCPEGTWSNVTEMSSIDGCQICAAGYVCAESGRTVPPTESNAQFPLSALCPEGYVCNAGTNTSTEKSHPCPAGYFCNFGTTNQTQFSHQCAAGYFCPQGATNTTANENICPAGYFCPAGTPDSPLFISADQCPLGTTSDPGATSALECYKTCRYGDVNSCVVVAQADALGNGSALSVKALGYAVVTFDFRSVYANPIATDLQYNNHFRISIYLAGKRQNMSSFFDQLAGQPPRVEMAIFGMVSVQPSLQIDILHGFYIQAASLFSGVANYTVYYPHRTSYGSVEQLFALVVEKDIDDYSLQLPLNMVTNDQVSLIIDDCNPNSTFVEIMDTQADLLQTASYWRLATYAQKDSGLVTLPFLPFFSSCEGYDGHIPIGHIFEQPNGCDLVDPADTVPISNFGLSISPVADTCDLSIQCTFEETMALTAATRGGSSWAWALRCSTSPRRPGRPTTSPRPRPRSSSPSSARRAPSR